MTLLILYLTQVLSLVLPPLPCSPQYGGGGGSSLPANTNPAVQENTAVNCWTEQATVWDTQYVETETQECQTVQMTQCNTLYQQQCVPTQRQECRMVTEQSCSKVPYEDCKNVPQQQCNQVHKKVPQRFSKSVPKKVCDDGGSYGTVRNTGGTRQDDPRVRLRSSDAVNFGG